MVSVFKGKIIYIYSFSNSSLWQDRIKHQVVVIVQKCCEANLLLNFSFNKKGGEKKRKNKEA